jgi:hypothetical protein
MARRQAGVWAGVVLGVLFLGGGTSQSPVGVDQLANKGRLTLADAQEVGPEGGYLNAGPYSLAIPPGALSSAVTITLTQEVCDEWPVRLEPEGLQFALPATLAFDAASEPNPASMTVAWWNPSTSQWVDQATTHEGTVASTQISHFSRFVLH